jgi:hypothetical protein
MSVNNQFDLEIGLRDLDVAVGTAWQMPDGARVSICVGGSRSVLGVEAHCGPAERDYHPLTHAGLPHYQHLVVRAGPWECYPVVTFLRRCVNHPGLRVRLGELRDACREFAVVGEELLAMDAMGTGRAPQEPVKARFSRSAVTLRLWDCQRTVKGGRA